jgi:hypothetical protein
MSETKVQLSQVELELAANAEVILTKNAIIEKIKLLFSELQLKQQRSLESLNGSLSSSVKQSRPKIYRGEKYNDLPYVLLDYPQVFSKEEVFAVRTLFWWGNFFSVTLHLSGQYKINAEPFIINRYELLRSSETHICINNDEWEHHFDDGNYRPVSGLTAEDFEEEIKKRTFIKLALKTTIAGLPETSVILLRYFNELLELVSDHAPRR